MDRMIQFNIPEKLFLQADLMIKQGWVSDIDSLFAEALRRFLESHNQEIMEHFIQEDVSWGLHGEE